MLTHFEVGASYELHSYLYKIHGSVNLKTDCHCGENGCLDKKVLEKNLRHIINAFEKENILVEFETFCINFRLPGESIAYEYNIHYNEEENTYQ